jgi:hypothetical protein
LCPASALHNGRAILEEDLQKHLPPAVAEATVQGGRVFKAKVSGALQINISAIVQAVSVILLVLLDNILWVHLPVGWLNPHGTVDEMVVLLFAAPLVTFS